MARRHNEEPQAEETQEYVLAQDVNVGGQDCKKGGKLSLTAEQAEAMKAAGVRFEGDEEPSAEDIQAKHDEGVEAQKARIEADAKAEEEDEAEEESV